MKWVITFIGLVIELLSGGFLFYLFWSQPELTQRQIVLNHPFQFGIAMFVFFFGLAVLQKVSGMWSEE